MPRAGWMLVAHAVDYHSRRYQPYCPRDQNFDQAGAIVRRATPSPRCHGLPLAAVTSGPATPTMGPHNHCSARRRQPGQPGARGGESAGGIAPPAALRTGRDSLPSSGPHSPPGSECDEFPVGEQVWRIQVDLLQPGHGLGVLAFESLELAHGPPGQVMVDAPCEEEQLGAVEGPVVVDPAPDLRIDSIREAGQVRAAAQVEVPGPDLTAFRFLRAGADGRVEAGEISALAQGLARPEGIAKEIEAGVLVISPAVRVLAVSGGPGESH